MAIKDAASFGRALVRLKKIQSNPVGDTKLDRCLTTLDLTALGIGSTLGLGIYVLAGQVASTKAGPAVVISFLVAAVASVFAGLCYAEFGARVPRAGSAYVYSYVTVGEFMAFVIGWNLVLEYVIGTASVARGYSGYIDSMFNGTIAGQFREWMPIDIDGFSEYPDFLAFGITLLLTIMLAIGVKESTRFNTVFTCINLIVVVYVIVCGSFKVDFHNWNLSKEEVPASAGNGGFLPYGFSGMMAGAATCFYGFIGFDCVATTGEEAKNPAKSIPIAICVSLLFIFIAYFGVSAVQTLMWPYYLQDHDASLPYVFEMVGWPVAKWIISVGALAGLSTSLLGAMFPLPRVLYAMASDGMIFRRLAIIHPRFKTPLLATLSSGIFAGGMAAIFNVTELADMMSIGTLLAYSLVAISVLILRYQQDGIEQEPEVEHLEEFSANPIAATPPSSPRKEIFTSRMKTRQIFNLDNHKVPTRLSSRQSLLMIIAICFLIVVLATSLIILQEHLFAYDTFSVTCITVELVVLYISIFALSRQPQSTIKLSFNVPWVPVIPFLSVFFNVYLMLNLTTPTWIRFGVWMIIGLSIYGAYGFWESTGSMSDEEKRQHFIRRAESKMLLREKQQQMERIQQAP